MGPDFKCLFLLIKCPHFLNQLTQKFWDRIHKTLFSLELQIEPNKLECDITQERKSLPVKNTLAYYAYLS